MFLENSFTLLHADPELVESVKHDPALLRKLAKSSFNTVVTVNHPDVGGDGTLIDEVNQGIAEINGATDEELAVIVDDFVSEKQLSSNEVVGARKMRHELENERRVAEVGALMRCLQAPQPRFSKIVVELGISTPGIMGPDNFNIPSQSDDSEDDLLDEIRFVLLDEKLQGVSMKRTTVLGKDTGLNIDIRDADNYVFGEDDSVEILNGYAVEDSFVEGEDLDAPEYMEGRISTVPHSIKFGTDKKLRWKEGIAILGAVQRRHIEGGEQGATTHKLSELESAKKASDNELDWSDAERNPWLQFMEVAHTDNMEDKYVIVQSESRPGQLAILGLCRKIAR